MKALEALWMVSKSGSPGCLLSHSEGMVLRFQIQGESMSPEQNTGHRKEKHGPSLRDLVPGVTNILSSITGYRKAEKNDPNSS